MYFRKDRVKLHGKTNFEYKSQGPFRPEDQSRVDFLATARANKFDQVIAKRLAATISNPVSQSQDYYHTKNKTLKEPAQLSRPRFAHLEEKERRKPVWVGDSYLVYTQNDELAEEASPVHDGSVEKIKKMKKELIQAKHDQHGNATQETQLVGMEKYSKETLEGKVDITKVKEIRRAIRRRYANRKNFQKIFTLWDEEGNGKLSVGNVFAMIKKLGLNINLDEARVLVASADEDRSGDLSLDEFMNLIFNDNEALNVDLGKLKVLSNEQEKLLLEGQDDQLDDILKEQTLQQKEKRQFNQLSLILKNKLQNLHNVFQTLDPLKQGQVNFEKFQEAIDKQSISEKIVNPKIIKQLYDTFKKDEYNIDYRAFLKHLKEFELQSDYAKHEEKKHKVKAQFTISLNPLDEKEKIHIVDITKANAHQLESLRSRAKRMVRCLQRYIPERSQFDTQILKQDQKNVSYLELTQQLSDFLTNCGEKVDVRDLGALLSIMQYNNKQVPQEKVGYYIYEEGDEEFYERCSQRKKGPIPLSQSVVLVPEVAGEDIQSNEGFYDTKFGLSTLASTITKDLGEILTKVETAIFRASARQYEQFTKFDLDKDGYVSQQDLRQKITDMHILNEKEMGMLIHYVDPENKGSVNFQEFYRKLYPGMTMTDSNGKSIVVPSLYPAKERNENLKTKLPKLKKDITQSIEFKGATRFGATPIHKNTFLNVQRPPMNSSLYMDEQDRFEKDGRLRYLRESQVKEKQDYGKKLERIRNHQVEIHQKIESTYQSDLLKEENKCRTKGMATWSYEQRAHIQNEWK